MTAYPRPVEGDHAEYYARYVAMVPDGDILQTLIDQLGDTLSLLLQATEEQETYRYAEGKWSVREVVGHMIDTERVFAYRAVTMARSNGGVDLPGMDQDEWVANSDANERDLGELAQEWAALRRANVHMYATISAEAAAKMGKASGFDFAVRSFPWITAGHELWHRERLVADYGLGVSDETGDAPNE